MNFKQLIAHYESLPKDQLIQKLVDKNALLLKQENEIERLGKELKDLREIEQDHKQLNGNLKKELDKLKERNENTN
jgi:predicted RNase H-like nuclease (RuvC/YqgF family)